MLLLVLAVPANGAPGLEAYRSLLAALVVGGGLVRIGDLQILAIVVFVEVVLVVVVPAYVVLLWLGLSAWSIGGPKFRVEG